MLIEISRAVTKKITKKYVVEGLTRELRLYTIKYLFNTKSNIKVKSK